MYNRILRKLAIGITWRFDYWIWHYDSRQSWRLFFIWRKNTSFYRFDTGKFYWTARNSNVSAKQSNPRCKISARCVLIKIKIRKLQQKDRYNFAIRKRATCFRLCRLVYTLILTLNVCFRIKAYEKMCQRVLTSILKKTRLTVIIHHYKQGQVAQKTGVSGGRYFVKLTKIQCYSVEYLFSRICRWRRKPSNVWRRPSLHSLVRLARQTWFCLIILIVSCRPISILNTLFCPKFNILHFTRELKIRIWGQLLAKYL